MPLVLTGVWLEGQAYGHPEGQCKDQTPQPSPLQEGWYMV